MNRSNSIANAIISFAPVAIVALVSFALNPIASLVVVCLLYAFGFAKLTRSKMSVFKNHQWVSFGPAAMDAKNRKLYFQGYAAIVIATSIILVTIPLARI